MLLGKGNCTLPEDCIRRRIGVSSGNDLIGITFTVRSGGIVSKGGPDVPIPEDGYVIFVSNSRVNRWTDVMFPVGASVDYQVQFNYHNDTPVPNNWEWQHVRHAIGCGPRLVTNGAVCDRQSKS